MPNFEILIETANEDLPIPFPVLPVGTVADIETAKLIASYLREFSLREDQFIILRTTKNGVTSDALEIIQTY